jgi:hypothetical protein
MSYNDVYRLRFKTFKDVREIIAHTKPYRGSTNIYPLGERRYNDRTFVFKGDHVVIRYGSIDLLKFHEDDSIEFTRGSYYGGMNMMLSAFLYPNVVHCNIRMGGDVITGADNMHPIFKGLRIYLENLKLHPTVTYNYRYKILNRTKTKVIRKQWEERFKTVKAFFLVGDSEQMIKEYHTSDCRLSIQNMTFDGDTYLQFLCIAGDSGYVRQRSTSWGNRNFSLDKDREAIFKKVREKFLDHLYLQQEDVFEWKEVEIGKRPPLGNRGVEVNYTIKEAI